MKVTYNNNEIVLARAKDAIKYYILIKNHIKDTLTGKVTLEHNNKIIKTFTGPIPCE